jgi:hypothetical protein
MKGAEGLAERVVSIGGPEKIKGEQRRCRDQQNFAGVLFHCETSEVKRTGMVTDAWQDDHIESCKLTNIRSPPEKVNEKSVAFAGFSDYINFRFNSSCPYPPEKMPRLCVRSRCRKGTNNVTSEFAELIDHSIRGPRR